MDPSFTRKKQMSEEHFAAQPEEVGRETTPKAITQDVITFSHMLGSEPEFVPVRSDAYGLFGWCSDGVEEKVRHDVIDKTHDLSDARGVDEEIKGHDAATHVENK